MASPATTTRATPGGIRLPDGATSKVAFSLDSDISLWETEVTPPGMDGGEKIDITTMHNTTYSVFVPQQLITNTPISFTAAYDPAVYSQIVAIINSEGSVTVSFYDGSTVDVFAYLQKFEPNGMTRGGMPLANVTVEVTNYDPVNRLEVGPVITEVAGT